MSVLKANLNLIKNGSVFSKKEFLNRLSRDRYTVLLSLLVLVSLIIRLKGLDYQSLWIDELYTVIESNPDITLGQVLEYLDGPSDAHPPLQYVILHYWLKLFGYTDYNARLLSAIVGVLGVIIIYFLGKELYNRNAGLLASLITAVNFYHLNFSQEVRNYIFAFFFTCLSFYYLIQAIKEPSLKRNILYGVSAALLLYTHYYGLAVIGAQCIIIAIFLFVNLPDFKKNTGYFILSGVLIILLYLPWVDVLFKINQISSFWAPKPQNNFFIEFFSEYFNHNQILIYTFSLLLIVFFTKTAITPVRKANAIVQNKLVFSFIILTIWIIATYLIPYLRSLISTPMLLIRYTIITLPGILLAIAIGLENITNNIVKAIVVVFIIIISYTSIFLESDYYTKISKTQFRQMLAYVTQNNKNNHRIYSDRAWFLSYYLNKYQSKARVTLVGNETSEYFKDDRFWIVTGHNGNPINSEELEKLKTKYDISKEFTGYDCWARLFIKAGSVPPVKLSAAPPETNNVAGDFFSRFEEDNGLVRIEGWGIIEDQSAENSETSILLQSDKDIYLFPANTVNRPDVTAFYKTLNFNEAGFKASISKKYIEPGTYRVGIQIVKGDSIKAFRFVDKILKK